MSESEIYQIFLCIDPGSSKSGVAVLNLEKKIIDKTIVRTVDLENYLKACINTHKPDIILIGNATWSKKLSPVVQSAAAGIPVKIIDERHSTERAKLRYFKENPPRGLWKLIPITLQVPKEPVDDYAAIVMAEDFIDTLSNIESK